MKKKNIIISEDEVRKKHPLFLDYLLHSLRKIIAKREVLEKMLNEAWEEQLRIRNKLNEIGWADGISDVGDTK